MFKVALFAALLVATLQSKCAYRVEKDGRPVKVSYKPFMVQGLTQCVEYNGKLGCCDVNNDVAQISSYLQIDGVFGSQGGGCDICAINLKRFWCEYACSPRQGEFISATKEFFPVPDPAHPGQTVMVQKVNLTVHADTACSLFNSCKRVGFVSSVSAMSSPAGFLTFQGHNAVDQAFQFIDVQFSYNLSQSLYFRDEPQHSDPEHAALQICNYTTPSHTLHGFKILKNCSCNNCEDSCDSRSGFVYTESGLFEGFNWELVLGVWSASLAFIGIVTIIRRRQDRQKEE